MGIRIVEGEQHGGEPAQYGEKLVYTVSKALMTEFGKGFSIANLRNVHQFYLFFQEDEKHYALRSELSWRNYRLIMRVKEQKARMNKSNRAISLYGVSCD